MRSILPLAVVLALAARPAPVSCAEFVPPPPEPQVVKATQTLQALTTAAAKDHVGEERTVCGCVAGAGYAKGKKEGPLLLKLGTSAPDDSIRLVLPKPVRTKLLGSPEVDFLYKWACASGKILRDDKGLFFVVATDTASLVVRDEAEIVAPSTAPLKTQGFGGIIPDCGKGSLPMTDVEARYHAGKTRTVCGFAAGMKEVTDIPRKATLVPLGAPPPRQTLALVVPKDIQSEGWNVEKDLLNRRVCATGRIFVREDGALGLPIKDPQSVVPWSDLQRPGEIAQVCGTLAGAKELPDVRDKPLALYLDRPFPDQTVTVLIPQNLRHKFGDPAKDFLDKRICAAGTVAKNEKGAIGLFVRDKEDIVFWTDTLREGKKQTVCGEVVSLKDIPDVPGKPTALFLDRAPPDQSMALLISQNFRPKFGDPAGYLNKVVCATGKLIRNPKGVAALALRGPEDIVPWLGK